MRKMIYLIFVAGLLTSSLAFFNGCVPVKDAAIEKRIVVSATQVTPDKSATPAVTEVAVKAQPKAKVVPTNTPDEPVTPPVTEVAVKAQPVANEVVPTSTPITAAIFDKLVVNTNGIVVVDFWATWCGPCRETAPEMEKVAVALGDNGKVYKVDVDQERALAERYNIVSIPTILVFKDGKQVAKNVGYINSVKMLKIIDGVK